MAVGSAFAVGISRKKQAFDAGCNGKSDSIKVSQKSVNLPEATKPALNLANVRITLQPLPMIKDFPSKNFGIDR